MRVMTFNLRFENDRDGQNAWHYRRDMIVRLIEHYAPDILGTQEGKWDQLMFLKDNLPDYTPHLPGRVPDKIVQCPTLFVHNESFAILDGGDMWLSKTPDVYMSKDWNSAFPRMMSHARLESRNGGGERLCAVVTHLDHIGSQARYHQAGIIAEWVKGVFEPKVVMGDFNDGPDTDVHRILTAPETGLLDTWQLMERREGRESYTHHGFTGIAQACRMDWILISRRLKVEDACVIKDNEDGWYPSDHFPYMADLAWRR